MAPVHLIALAFLSLFTTTALSQQDEQQTSLEFYMHDNVFVPNPSGIPVAGANGTNSGVAFGTILVIDDALTEGPSTSSKPVGRGQGTYMFAGMDGVTLMFTFTAVFSDRNGTLSFHGSDKVTVPTRELAVVGGTGIYRFARGYAVITTASVTGLSVVLHFNVTFQHSTEIKASSSPSTSSAPVAGSSGDKSFARVTLPSYWLFLASLALACVLQGRSFW